MRPLLLAALLAPLAGRDASAQAVDPAPRCSGPMNQIDKPHDELPPLTSYAELGMPLPKEKLTALLQRFASETYGRGFRHLGSAEDLYHGHFLWTAAAAEPAAILYHTQERAAYHPPGPPYGYLDRETRNWLQWTADGAVENANGAVRDEYPDTPAWKAFVEKCLPQYQAKYTVVPAMLDPAKLPGRTSDDQFSFLKDPACEPGESRVDIGLPGQRVCLRLKPFTRGPEPGAGAPPAAPRSR